MDQHFAATKEIADGIEGMMSHFSMAVIDSLLAYQAERAISGDLAELGVFRGRSAAVLARRAARSETLRLYDIEDCVDRQKIDAVDARLEFFRGSTLALSRRDFREKSTRFCHIDTSHSFDATLHELSLADHMLGDDGLLCLDDFTNLDFSQILAATFKYLFTRRTNLAIFLVTAEKAYLCRRPALELYETLVLNGMIGMMTDRGIANTCIARTDITGDHRAFHLRSKLAGEVEDRYGQSIYGDRYTAEQLPGIATKLLHFAARNIRRKKYATRPSC